MDPQDHTPPLSDSQPPLAEHEPNEASNISATPNPPKVEAADSGGLATFLERHPLPVLIAVAFAVGSAVAGVMQYFQAQTVSRLASEKTEAIRSAVSPLEKNISTLTSANDQLRDALASFRRTAGPTATMFDIRRLILNRNDIRSLSSAYKYFDAYQVYVAAPTAPEWQFEETSEGALAIAVQPNIAPILQEMFGKGPLFKKNILAWRSPKLITVQLENDANPLAALLGKPAKNEMNLFPFVAIQRVDRALLKEALSSFSFESDKPANTAKLPKQPVAADDAMLKLEEMFSADLAGSVLITQSTAMLMIAQANKNVSFRIENAENKGPVLYLNARIEFHDVAIKGRSGRHSVTMDKEIMVTAIGDTAYLMLTAVPTIGDARSDAYSWISQWIQNVKIPCDCVTPALSPSPQSPVSQPTGP